jgi:aminopeptidase
MLDPRVERLAAVLVAHSVRVRAGDRVLVESFDMPPEVVAAVVERIAAAGGLPLVETRSQRVLRSLYRTATEAQMRQIGELELARMRAMDGYIGLRGAANSSELADVPAEQLRLYQRYWWKPVHAEERCSNTRWVVLRWPTPSMAQQAGMSTDAFEDFYFDVCTLDYGRLEAAVRPLKQRLEAARAVRLLGPGTDLRFSIAGIPAVACTGRRNIPDGECFTAPVRDSAEGTIRFNAASLYQGRLFENVSLTFQAGKIVAATASDPAGLNQILDADEGARYLGEWSIAFHPRIFHPMRDTLFDEKIAGSLHLTPGSAYEVADNGNRSEIHWDLVLIQRPDYGGGEIWLDGECIRRDGRFLVPDLEGLNPERLLAETAA